LITIKEEASGRLLTWRKVGPKEENKNKNRTMAPK
jgi:hypothetical protein